MRRIKVAQIGASRYSHGCPIFHIMTQMPERFEVAGYALPEHEREKFPTQMWAFEGYREMSVEEIMADETIEAVVVETEEIYLTRYALMAASHKKHVHMEKPGGLDPTEFETLVRTAKENGTVFHTGYMFRYNPSISDILRRVKGGEIGRVVSVDAQMNGWHDIEQARWLADFPGGMMFYLGCHMIDLILTLQGTPKNIYAFNKSSGTFDVPAKDFCMAVFEYENGVSYVRTTQADRGGFSRRQLVITGTEGTFEVRPLEAMADDGLLQYTEYTKCTSEDWYDAGKKTRCAPYDRYREMMVAFARMVAKEIENPYTYDYELMLYKTIAACCK